MIEEMATAATVATTEEAILAVGRLLAVAAAETAATLAAVAVTTVEARNSARVSASFVRSVAI